MIKRLTGVLGILLLWTALAFAATDPQYKYFIIGDTNPTTKVWDTDAGALVNNTDAGYLAWVATLQGPLAQTLTANVSASANNGSGLIRLTVDNTYPFTTGDAVAVRSTGTVADGVWVVTVIDAACQGSCRIDLQGSVYGGSPATAGIIGRGTKIATAAALQTFIRALQNNNDVINPPPSYVFLSAFTTNQTLADPVPSWIDLLPSTNDNLQIILPKTLLPTSSLIPGNKRRIVFVNLHGSLNVKIYTFNDGNGNQSNITIPPRSALELFLLPDSGTPLANGSGNPEWQPRPVSNASLSGYVKKNFFFAGPIADRAGVGSGDAATMRPIDVSDLPAFGGGDVSCSAGGVACTIAAAAVTYGKIQNVTANNRFLGRITAGAGSIEQLAAADAWTILGVQPAANHPALTGDCTTSSGAVVTTCLLFRGMIDGLILSNDGTTPNTKLDISAGVARDDTNAATISFASAKIIDCTTTGALGLDAGSLANSTWYHVFAIAKADGTMSALASTSVSSPTMPSGYIYKRRIGSFKTDGSAHIIAFSQEGDEFLWSTSVEDVNTNAQSTTAITRTLTVPTGVKVRAIIAVQADRIATNGNYTIYVSSPDASDEAVSGPGTSTPFSFMQYVTASGAANPISEVDSATAIAPVRTNTSGQVRTRASAALTGLWLRTYGWFDQRGKNN